MIRPQQLISKKLTHTFTAQARNLLPVWMPSKATSLSARFRCSWHKTESLPSKSESSMVAGICTCKGKQEIWEGNFRSSSRGKSPNPNPNPISTNSPSRCRRLNLRWSTGNTCRAHLHCCHHPYSRKPSRHGGGGGGRRCGRGDGGERVGAESASE